MLLWLILLAIRPSALATSSLGGVSLAFARRLSQRFHKGPVYAAAVEAVGLVFTRSAVGYWSLSIVSHGLWMAFNAGLLVLLMLLLSTKQYTFVWETTILSDGAYVAITETMAAVPGAIGFTTPSQSQILASHRTDTDSLPPDTSEAWSGLLVGSILVYGLLPRAALLLLCLLMGRREKTRFRLNLALPGYARLQTRLLPVSDTLGVVDADDNPPARHWRPGTRDGTEQAQHHDDGPIAILGLEIDSPRSGWPPLDTLDWLDLGFVDNRADRLRALDQVRSALQKPRFILVVCSLTTTPDRGIQVFLEHLQRATSTPLVLVLTDGQRLRARGYPDDVIQRSADWQQLAEKIPITKGQLMEVDLDHLTEASRAKLTTSLGIPYAGDEAESHIERAFAVILEYVQRWQGSPNAIEQAELHRAIGVLYQDAPSSWQSLLHSQVKPNVALTEQLQSSSQRMVNLLPIGLRQDPRWLSAGAMAGALSCVVAATLVTPAAIASLPLWAGLGAAVSAIVPKSGANQAVSAAGKTEHDITAAVRSAALFALVLELQGHDEATITRIMDRTVAQNEPVIHGEETARQWLVSLHRRLDRALAMESAE